VRPIRPTPSDGTFGGSAEPSRSRRGRCRRAVELMEARLPGSHGRAGCSNADPAALWSRQSIKTARPPPTVDPERRRRLLEPAPSLVVVDQVANRTPPRAERHCAARGVDAGTGLRVCVMCDAAEVGMFDSPG
jgi:hypothetical protein